jgi:hypothetical protein
LGSLGTFLHAKDEEDDDDDDDEDEDDDDGGYDECNYDSEEEYEDESQ